MMMIEVQRLTRRFPGTVALDGVTFSVAAGEVVGFLGPNGAGKSTTMKILTCSLAPSSGTAKVAGFDVQDDPVAVRGRIGFMPEHVPLYPENSVDEFLGFVADLKGVARRDRAVHLAAIRERTGLVDVRRRRVGNLSKGFRQRVGLAQALVGDPEVLILDEPGSGLDPLQIVEIRDLVRGFRGEKTVLMSSHILAEVDRVCERVLILDGGRLVSDERAAKLLADPKLRPRVALIWDGARAEVCTALTQLAGVSELTETDTGAEVVITGDPAQVRPQLAAAVVAAGGRLQSLEDRASSLEDMFLRLTDHTAGDQSLTDRSPTDEVGS